MQNHYPIFTDPTRRRWRRLRRVLFYLAGLATVLVAILLVSIVLNPFFRPFSLPKPVMRLLHKAEKHKRPRTAPGLARRQAAFRKLQPKALRGGAVQSIPRLSAFYVNWDPASLSSLRTNLQSMDRLYPQWLFLEDASGNVELREDGRVMGLAEDNPDLRIMPLVMNYDEKKGRWMAEELNAALNHAGSRHKLVEQLARVVHDEKYAGLMVDFEYVAPETRDNYIRFLEELAAALHADKKRLEVSVEFDRPASIAYAAIGRIVDQVVLMAYDQHAATTAAGPICSITWFSDLLDKRLQDIPKEKIIIAIGNYGYDWVGTSKTPRSMGFNECLNLAAQTGSAVDFDPDSFNPTFNFVDDKNQEHEIWYMDAVTAFNVMQASLARGVSSFALWRLGLEDATLWSLPSSDDRPSIEKHLSRITQGPRLAYEGEGDMIVVKNTATPGNRKISWDPETRLISDAEITSFPELFTLSRYGRADKKIVLTFDDGPDRAYTPKILDILKRYDVRADFFVIGLNAEDGGSLVRRAYREGHEIGNHTFTHPNIIEIPRRQFELELNSTERLLETLIGHNCVLFRPPFNVDAEPATPEEAAPIAFASQLGYVTVGAGIDPADYLRPGVDKIVQATLDGLGTSNVILLHDGGGNRQQTVAALPQIIETARARGYEFVTLSTLLGKTRDDVMPPLTRNQSYLRLANTVSFGVGKMFVLFSRWGLIIGVSLGVIQFVFYSIMALIQRARNPESPTRYGKPIDVIVPAYNEEKVITYTIKSLLQSEGVDLNIIAVDDGSTDGTLNVLREGFGNHPKVRIVTQPNGGKASALNHGISLSQADVVVTLDSDTIFTHDCIDKLTRPFNDPTVSAVAGNAKVGNRINILTRWQSLEYITTQNFIRRSNALINCITVVPGAVGAWRREVLRAINGYRGDTLAEDGELTVRVLEAGGKIVYADGAVAWTEAPQDLRTLFRQRFRWMYGTFQTAWKHRGLLFNLKQKALGWIAMPNMFIFQIVFPFTAPLMDLVMFLSLLFFLAQRAYHPADFAADQLRHVVFFYAIFLLFDLATAILSIFLEPKREDFSLLVWLPWQRFFYRQLNHWIAIKTMFKAMQGEAVGWGHLTRNASHLEYFSEKDLSEKEPSTISQAVEDEP